MELSAITEKITIHFSSIQVLHPTTISVIGPTFCGKTQFVKNVILNKLFDPEPDQIFWVYSKPQSATDELDKRFGNFWMYKSFNSELLDRIRNYPHVKKLVILDDQMTVLADNPELSKLFTEDSHHCNTTVMMLMQNPFPKGKSMRDVSLNSHYKILFQNQNDELSMRNILNRLELDKNKTWLHEIYEDATRKPFGYLIVNCHPHSSREQKYITDIFEEDGPVMYRKNCI